MATFRANALAEDTLEFWKNRTTRTLTSEDAREICANAAGFFGVLREWAIAAAADNLESAPNEDQEKEQRPNK